ncbi:MAG: hypothetical protein ACLQVX_15675 [Limisphaerales bacterium]
MISTAEQPARPFLFERDTFTFANELIWQYRFDPDTGATTVSRTDPPPAYSHRCFVMVRSVRQFFYHARFDPALPRAKGETYQRLIREVVSRSPRKPSQESRKVVVPGYDCLRSFSRACEPILKAGLGGPWESYFVRSHWRMVAPTGRRHQERMAQQLRDALSAGRAPIVHLYRFPRITINHGVVLFGSTQSDGGTQFQVYDPNIPDRPLKLIYERAARTFNFPRTLYWAGGALNVFEMYLGGLY